MNKPTLLFIAFITVAGVTLAAPHTPAQTLLKRLWKLQKRGLMIGHQDDPVYGRSWKWDEGRSDIKDVCGDYPAVMGFDLGKIEHNADKNLDGVPFERMRKEIVAQHERGGIVTLSWHPDNPITSKTAWDASPQTVKGVLSGGVQHAKLNSWLQYVADFINSLKTPSGKKVPVIFRPWHEMNGSWFWWGSKSCTPEEFQQLYRYTFEQLTNKYLCNNIVWAYSPNFQANDNEEQYLKYYPGDTFVDLMGIDIYDFEHRNDTYQTNLQNELELLTRIATDKNKLAALTETGAQQLPDARWFTQVFWQIAQNYTLCYVLFWRNAWDAEKEMYMTASGHTTERDFKAFYNEKRTLFLNDIRKVR